MRRKQKRTALPDVDADVRPELLDPAAAVWHNLRAYHRFMAEHGWMMPPSERMGCPTSPANRRQAAAAGWAYENGIVVASHRGID